MKNINGFLWHQNDDLDCRAKGTPRILVIVWPWSQNEGCPNEYRATLPVAADRKPKRMTTGLPSLPALRIVPSLLKTGAVMIREGVLLPECVHIETLSYSAAWRSVVNDDSFAVDRKLRAAGWQFFFIAGELKVIEPGWGASTIRRGTNRILARGGKRNLNCMEITQIAAARFLGIPFVSIRAFSYHIQKEAVLQSNAERTLAQNDADWACRHSLPPENRVSGKSVGRDVGFQ